MRLNFSLFRHLLLAGFAATAARASDATPADLYGPLFEAVQIGKVFADGKNFVDATPRIPVAEIMADHARGRP